MLSLNRIRDKGKIVSAGQRRAGGGQARGWGKGGEMTQTLYAHTNKRKKKIVTS
jgi:hypothetical protein